MSRSAPSACRRGLNHAVDFPIAIPAWTISPALCHGTRFVFKPAELVPGSAMPLSEIIARAGFPAGVFNLVFAQARGRPTMLEHPECRGDIPSPARSRLRKIRPCLRAVGADKKFQLRWLVRIRWCASTTPTSRSRSKAPSTAPISHGQRCTASSRADRDRVYSMTVSSRR